MPNFPSFAHELKWSLGIGAATTFLILVMNHWIEPALPEALRAANQDGGIWRPQCLWQSLSQKIWRESQEL